MSPSSVTLKQIHESHQSPKAYEVTKRLAFNVRLTFFWGQLTLGSRDVKERTDVCVCNFARYIYKQSISGGVQAVD